MIDYSTVRKVIQQSIRNNKNDFIIYPFGENGLEVKRILNECFVMNEKIIIDNNLSIYNKKIKDIKYLLELKDVDKVCVLNTSNKVNLYPVMEKGFYIANTVEGWIYEKDKFDFEPIHLHVGKGSYGPLIKNSKIEKIGAFCSFASGTDAVWNHQLNMVSNHDFIYTNEHARKITRQKYNMSSFNKKYIIGNDVWLGKNVILTNGIKIGNGVRVAAGSVVTKNIPDFAIVAGIPAKIIGYRFTEEQIVKLNKIAWWDWPMEKIKKCYDDFMNIDLFLEKHYVEE